MNILILIIFPLLSLIRGKSFDSISKLSNWGLIVAGILLLIYQLNGFFTSEPHNHDNLEKIDIPEHLHPQNSDIEGPHLPH